MNFAHSTFAKINKVATPTSAYTCMYMQRGWCILPVRLLWACVCVYRMGVGLLSCLSADEAVRRPKDGMDNGQDSPPFYLCLTLLYYIEVLGGSASACLQRTAMIHIGKRIEAVLREKERTVAWFARKLYCNRQNVYDIFKRESIDTTLLQRISVILEHNFFRDLSDYVDAGGDK